MGIQEEEQKVALATLSVYLTYSGLQLILKEGRLERATKTFRNVEPHIVYFNLAYIYLGRLISPSIGLY